MKIAFDIHGVCDSAPEFFSLISKLLVENKNEVHILTGREVNNGAIEELKALGIHYTHFFSIADHHKSIGTEMWKDEKGRPWLDDELWDATKGEYCEKHGIDFCLDDTEAYGEYFKTPFAFMKIKK